MLVFQTSDSAPLITNPVDAVGLIIGNVERTVGPDGYIRRPSPGPFPLQPALSKHLEISYPIVFHL